MLPAAQNETASQPAASMWHPGCLVGIFLFGSATLFSMMIGILSENMWIGFMAALPILLLSRRQYALRTLMTAIFLSGILLTLHFNGIRIYGKPVYQGMNYDYDKGTLIKLTPPNTATLSEGDFQLFGILLSNPLNPEKHDGANIETFDLLRECKHAHSCAAQTATGRPIVQLHNRKPWCGNSYTPHFFPQTHLDIPRDLGELLVKAGAAVPDWDALKADPEYAKRFEKYRTRDGVRR